MAKQENLTHSEIINSVKKGQYKPVYFLMGEESYYIDLITARFENILDEPQKDFDQVILYGKDTDIRRVIDEARAFPMMSPHRIIIVKEAQNIKDYDLLSLYLKNPQPTSILVFSYKHGKPDGRKKFINDVKNTGIIFESKKLYENQVPAWIINYTKEKALTIDMQSAGMLASYLGTDLSKIANEINKLSLILPEGKKNITPEVIENNIGISKEYNNYELQAALINKNILLANRIIRYFADNPKDNPIVVTLTVLFNFFSNVMIYHYMKDKSETAVAQELGISPYFVRDYIKAGTAYNGMKTFQILHEIRETDAKAKGFGNVSADHGELLKELICKILH